MMTVLGGLMIIEKIVYIVKVVFSYLITKIRNVYGSENMVKIIN